MAGFEITTKKEEYTWKILIMRMAAVFFVLTSVFGAYLSVFDIGMPLPSVILRVGIALLTAMLLCQKGKYQKLRMLVGCGVIAVVLYRSLDRILGGLVPYVNSYVDRMNQFYRTNMLFMAAQEDLDAALLILGFLALLFAVILWRVLEARKGKCLAVLVILLPVILAAIVGEMPATFWCWCLMVAGVCYMIVCNLKENKIPGKEIAGAFVILGVMMFLSSMFVPMIHKYKEQNQDAYKEVKSAIIASQQIDWDEIAARFIPEDENFGGGGDTDGELAELTGFYQTGRKITEVVLEEKPTKAVYHRDFIGAYFTGDRWLPPETAEYSSELYVHGYDNENLDELSAICLNMNQTSTETVSSVINRIFSDGFRYESNPGKMPEDRGFVEGFLFEKKEGFCVHFATAATMIYRLCRWPARYVEGYKIEPEAFELQEDGTYKAIVTDYMGHAWCETYEGRSGWKVREHTIASYEDEIVATPTATPTPEDLDENILENEDNQLDQSELLETGENGNNANVSAIGGSDGPQHVGGFGAALRVLRIFAGIVCITIGVFLIIVLQQKIRRSRKTAGFRILKENQGIRNLYGAIHEVCEFGEFAKKSTIDEQEHLNEQTILDGQTISDKQTISNKQMISDKRKTSNKQRRLEKQKISSKQKTSDMQTELQRVQYLAEGFTQLSEEEWFWIYDCAERAAYSGQLLTKEENKEMYHLYRKLRGEILKELSKMQKIWFLYGRVL